MLTYNLFTASVALLLYADYLVERYSVSMRFEARIISLQHLFLYAALFVMIFFAGFRFEIGYDYSKYLAGYIFDSELEHWEPFFNFIVRTIRHFNFGLGLQALFLFFSAATILVIYRALFALTPHYRFGLLLYSLIPSLYLNSFSVVRQGIALAILFYALQYITLKSDYKRYLLFAFVAVMFHYASLFASMAYLAGKFFFDRIYSQAAYVVSIVVSLALSFLHVGRYILLMMPGHFGLYVRYEFGVSTLKLLAVNGFFLFFMFQKEKFVKGRLERYLLNSFFLGLLIFNIFSNYIYVSRMAQYFLVAEIILVPLYLHTITDFEVRKVMTVLFLLYYLFNYDYALYRDKILNTRHDKHYLVPYRNYVYEKKKPGRVQYIEAWYDFILKNDEKSRGSR